MSMFNGYINIYKEKGMTSHDVVNKVRKILKIKKIGHTGTLDPNAEGVLILCIGKATKMIQFISDASKTYIGEVVFGELKDTDDMTGKTIGNSTPKFTEIEFNKALNSFLGITMQIPPTYSALKVNGKRLYQYAREGQVVKATPRPINVLSIEKIETQKLPNRATFRVNCSKGTYIRSICRDLGERLGCYSHMGFLVRERVGNYSIKNAVTLAELEKIAELENIDKIIHKIDDALAMYPKVTTTTEGDRFLLSGNKLYAHNINCGINNLTNEELVLLYTTKSFIGIGQVHLEGVPCIKPLKII